MANQDVRAGGHHYRLIAEASTKAVGKWEVMAIRDGEIWFGKDALESEAEARRFIHEWAVKDADDPHHQCSSACQSWKKST